MFNLEKIGEIAIASTQHHCLYQVGIRLLPENLNEQWLKHKVFDAPHKRLESAVQPAMAVPQRPRLGLLELQPWLPHSIHQDGGRGKKGLTPFFVCSSFWDLRVTLLLEPHWPEFSHMATPRPKEAKKCSLYTGPG